MLHIIITYTVDRLDNEWYLKLTLRNNFFLSRALGWPFFLLIRDLCFFASFFHKKFDQ